MSEIVPDPTPAVTDADPKAAVENAANDADNHTPASPISNDPPAPVADPTDGKDRLDKLEGIVGTLGDSVAALTTLVQTVVDRGNPDVSATKSVPWTHRGGKRHDHE